MKKIEIINLINKHIKLIQNKERLDSILNSDYNHWTYSINSVFPNISELNEEFDILKKELLGLEYENKELETYLSRVACTHPIRIRYSGAFYNYSICSLCGKKFNGDNISNGNTIYNDINRNSYCALFTGTYEDEDYGTIKGYELEDIYQMVTQLINKYSDDDVIDLVKEFSTLDNKDIIINNKPFIKEIYILIISGSNKINIDSNNTYLTVNNELDASKLAYLLLGIPNVKIEIFDSTGMTQNETYKNNLKYANYNNLRISTYTTIESLEEQIKKEQNVPFDLIINLSDLFTYSIENNILYTNKYDLNLANIFKNSYIMEIKESKNKTDKEILEELKKSLLNFDMSYRKVNEDKYYYLNNDNLDSTNLDKIYDNIKTKILKKK